MLKKGSCLLLVLTLCANLSRAQLTRYQKQLNSVYTNKADLQQNKADSNKYFLVQLKSPADASKLRLVKRLSYDYYIAASTSKINTGENLLSVAPANALWKATDDLALQAASHPNSNRQVTLVLRRQNATSVNNIRAVANIVSANGNNVVVNVPLKQLPALLADENIIFASPVRKAHEELAIGNLDLGVNSIAAVTDSYPELNGTGINVSLKEQTYDETDLDLLGRSFISAPRSDVISNHATVMATLIGGSGISYIKGLGAAPAVKLTSSDFITLLPDSLPYFTNFNIALQNHSYGTGIENYYGIEAVAYDKQLYENDTLIHVFSSGNIGTSTPATGLYNGLANVANLSGTFKQAKNVLVVGGTGRTNIPEALSSAGPTYDGRVKPELVADGEDGTSGAAALASGTVALMQQAYKLKFNKKPPAALLKSILINTADDLGTPEVDFKTGYGKMNALEAVRSINNNRFFSGTVSNQTRATYQVTVPANCSMLKIALAWNDAPATLNAPYALINDLDLSIQTPAGETLLPWVLSSYPNTDSLTKPATRQRDTLNNTEQITLKNPAAGTYTILVNGSRVITASQPFYIAYNTKQANSFEWTYPSPADKILATEDNYLRWQNTFTATNGKLSISYDHGATWQAIASVPLSGGYYKWNVPDVFTKAILKMSINGNDHLSKEFIISKPLALDVGFDCTDGTLLHWSPQPGATKYIVYNLKDNQLQQLTTVTDTTVIIPTGMQSSKYFAVSATGNGFEGVRSYTINATTQGTGCYVKNILAEVNNNNSIKLTLNVGSVFNLSSITWEKQTGINMYTDIGNSALKTALSYQFIDTNPKKGINYYRARLTKTDGSAIYSDLASAILLQSNQITLYPNPVSTQLNILTGELNTYELKLYDAMGILRFSKTLNGLQNAISLNVMPGMYICTVSANSKILYQGKIVKL
ncbi:T9SS C-terminal target domain-containing protein [Mucilaginibacter terrenus]|uniref:T9SS C-terminal target domain-containing protein n=1 Tax=Mucilaginibacter terrenus TaxID=2482727 RepID=A0A3E2NJ72_9SPHI|nr:S8 family serine peptidase [Mucilaginibacter terrenus]RFZ81054.1 T9SS C-terminal target domain-containing protein [Mucilaginibacter terrenus]